MNKQLLFFVLLIMHGTAVSMMQTTKTVRAAYLPKVSRNKHKRVVINHDTSVIMESLEFIEEKLEEQNKILRDLKSLNSTLVELKKVEIDAIVWTNPLAWPEMRLRVGEIMQKMDKELE